MLLEKEHVLILKEIGEGKSFAELKDIREINRRLRELKLMNLIEIKEGKISLTDAGKLIVEAYDLAKPKKMEPYWIGPDVIQILDLWIKTNHILEEWKQYIEPKGLLNKDAAQKILEAYRKSLPNVKLIVSSELIEFIKVIPPGPADIKELIRIREFYGLHRDSIKMLMMLKLLTISPPINGKVVYQLTPAGKLLQEVLTEIYIEFIGERLLNLLKKEEKTEEEKKELEELGLYKEEKLTEAGRKLLLVEELLRKEIEPPIPYFISDYEIEALKTIKEMWNKYNESPHKDLLPTFENVEERLKEKLKDKAALALYLALSKDLIKNVVHDKYVVLVITEKGSKALSFGPVSTEASKAILYGLTEKAPIYPWLEAAEREKLIYHWLTEKGETIIRWSFEKRTFVLTKYALEAIYKIPVKKYVLFEELLKDLGEEAREAIQHAEAFGLFIIERNGTIMLTKIGEKIKEMIEYGNTKEILHSYLAINPRSIEILKLYKEYLEEIKREHRKGKRIEEATIYVLSKVSKYPTEYIKKWITILRDLELIGELTVTKAGEALLEAVRMLEERELPEYYK